MNYVDDGWSSLDAEARERRDESSSSSYVSADAGEQTGVEAAGETGALELGVLDVEDSSSLCEKVVKKSGNENPTGPGEVRHEQQQQYACTVQQHHMGDLLETQRKLEISSVGFLHATERFEEQHGQQTGRDTQQTGIKIRQTVAQSV